MRRLLFPLLLVASFVFPALNANSQDQEQPAANPVQLSWEGRHLKDGQYEVKIKAVIESGWRLFSITMGDDEVNSRISLEADSHAKIEGNITESGNVQKGFDQLLEANTTYLEDSGEWTFIIDAGDSKKDINGEFLYMAIKGEEVVGPEKIEFKFGFDEAGNFIAKKGGLSETSEIAALLKRPAIDLKNPVMKVGGIGNEGETNPWFIFLLGFIGGLLALVTPCVFPMIPLTVSFFTKGAQDKKKGVFNAITYGFFIFLIYVLFSIPFHIAGAAEPEIFNNISTNVWLNLLFFAIFVVFAFSFFGFFEITLPGGLANKTGAKSGGNLIGIFFMALTLVVVSFSCTGPILGSLLAGAGSSSAGAENGAWLLTAGLAGFGVSLGLPFALFAMFPNWLNSLPKSGGWLGSVKVVLGFVELALAVKFLSNADLVQHWGILHRETFFLIWIIIGVLIVLYLLGVVRFPHDSPVTKFGKVRIFFIAVFAAFTIYLIPGITNTKYSRLKLMSGFAPPMSYSWYGNSAHEKGAVEPDVMNDYEAALKLAKEAGKPILVDFTGWACVNCRNMEENVWTDPEIHSLIKDNFVLVSLYVDDKKMLPKEDQFVYTFADGKKKEIRTVGNMYATMQTENFLNNSQPLYVLLSPDETLLTYPVAYTPDVDEYAKWLKAGIEGYKKISTDKAVANQ